MGSYLAKFVLRIAEDVKRGEVVRSRVATVGPYHPAVEDGQGSFAVFDDLDGEIRRFNGALSAAAHWNSINRAAMREGRI